MLVAAEAREFSGILRRFGKSSKLEWPSQFAREASWKGDRWLMIANGPGPRLIDEALGKQPDATAVISTGFCGALDPSLLVGDIVVGNCARLPKLGAVGFHIGAILSTDRVAVDASEKSALRAKTGAIAIEMESAAVARKAAEWSLPFYCIRSVSDTAAEDMPIDFNQYRDAVGRFSRTRIAGAALARPFTRVPALLRLERNCKLAAESLGEFFADCRF